MRAENRLLEDAMIDRDFILEKLSPHPVFFKTFLDYSTFEETSSIPTLGVYFDKYSYEPIVIKVNPKFWNSLNSTSQVFVTCHELMHILLRHGVKIYRKGIKVNVMNQAMDIVINHSLIDFYNFNFAELDTFLQTEGCWIETCFKGRNDILKNQTSEYYYDRLLENKNNDGAEGFDEHFEMSDEDVEALKEFLEQAGILEDFAASQNAEKVYENLTSASPTGEGLFHSLAKKRVPIKKKWETIIKKWESAVLKEELTDVESWDRVARRFGHVLNNPKIKLPTVINRLGMVKVPEMIDVLFFLDCSGSCISYKDRFFTAAKSLNPKRFNLKLYSYDTAVTLLDINRWQIRGGGGTAFDIIEREVQRVIKAEGLKKYPWVFNITDGDGNSVNPQVPERWFWFMTQGFSTRYVHPKSKVYNLADFE